MYKMTTCGKCNGRMFKVQRSEPSGSAFVVYFVQCSSCGVPAGVLEYANSAALIEVLTSKVNSLENKLDSISYQLSNIQNALTRG